MKMKFLLSNLLMSYYPVPGSHFSDKVEVNLDFSNNVTKKN